MLDTTFAVSGKTLNHGKMTFTIKGAGIRNDQPYAEVDPANEAVEQTIIRHIRRCMPLPFSLEDIQNELK